MYQLKQIDSSIGQFQQAVRLNLHYEKAFYALGMAYNDLKDFNHAETAFRHALKLSNSGETWFDLGLVLSAQKKYDEAFMSFQNSIKFGSIAASASHNNLGVIYAIKGEFILAKKEIELSKKLGFEEAENNLLILGKILISNDKSLVGKLILKEKMNER